VPASEIPDGWMGLDIGWVLTGLLFVFSSEHIPLFKRLQLFA